MRKRTKALSNNAVPRGLVFAIKIFLNKCCNVFLNIVGLQRLQAQEHRMRLTEACMPGLADGVHTCIAQLIASCRMSSRISTDFTVMVPEVISGLSGHCEQMLQCARLDSVYDISVVFSAQSDEFKRSLNFDGCKDQRH